MFIQLVDIKSSHPDFAIPKQNNGEAMELFSVEAAGQYVVVRYFGTEPVEGPGVERFFADLYYNQEGREIFRVKAKILNPPVPPPGFGARLKSAIIHVLSP